MRYKCSSCDDEHEGLPMAYVLEWPGVDVEQEAIEESRVGELCTIGGHHFIRANLELPYRGEANFVWTCWVSLSDASFRKINDRWESPDRVNDEPAFGWLSNELPTYEPTTWALKTRVHQRAVGVRPWVELEPTDHPLAVEQRNGIGDARIAAIYHAFSDREQASEERRL